MTYLLEFIGWAIWKMFLIVITGGLILFYPPFYRSRKRKRLYCTFECP